MICWNRDWLLRAATILVIAVTAIGCDRAVSGVKTLTASTSHEKFGWRAEDYFDDPQVIALCEAIEANDLAEIDRLVAAGADMNAQGKGKMTPLLWAFPDNKLERFQRLLEHGADPNVIIESDFNTRGAMSAGDSVTHMASKSAFPGYFDAVFNNGGNPNLVNSGPGKLNDTPMFFVIKHGGDKKRKIQVLLDKGADINYMNGAWKTPSMQATNWGGQYDLALMLLEAGADPAVYKPNSNYKLIHTVLSEGKRRNATWSLQQRANYDQLVKWLEDHGESLEEAEADKERWQSWSSSTGERRRKMDAEVSQRKLREAREQAAQQEQEDAAAKP